MSSLLWAMQDLYIINRKPLNPQLFIPDLGVDGLPGLSELDASAGGMAILGSENIVMY